MPPTVKEPLGPTTLLRRERANCGGALVQLSGHAAPRCYEWRPFAKKQKQRRIKLAVGKARDSGEGPERTLRRQGRVDLALIDNPPCWHQEIWKQSPLPARDTDYSCP